MTVRYDEPNLAARAGNELIRWLAEAGISIAGTRALRVRGRKSGKRRGVVINLLTVDGRDYVVSPRGNTPAMLCLLLGRLPSAVFSTVSRSRFHVLLGMASGSTFS